MVEKEAQFLRRGDGLIVMPKWQTTWSEIMGEDQKKSPYWMINNGRKNIFEHTFIYQHFKHKKMERGKVLHHRDHNGLNNRINNLKEFKRQEHDNLHDISGDKNPMRKWWNNASKQERINYRKKMSKAVSDEKNPNYSGVYDDEILKEMVNIIKIRNLPLTFSYWRKYSRKVKMPHTSPRWGISQTPLHLIREANSICGFKHYKNPAIMREYIRYLKREQTSDLNLFFDGSTYVIKECEVCSKKFIVKWGKRERAYCSHVCANKVAAIRAGITTKELAERRHTELIDNMADIFNQYIQEMGLIPTKTEFLKAIKREGIYDFRSAGLKDSYQIFLNLISKRYQCKTIASRMLRNAEYNKNMASKLMNSGLVYNHKIISVEKLGFDKVYNGTVDEFHNYGIVLKRKTTQTNRPKLEIIFSLNCGEQSLESFELCCLVETFPSRHDSYEEFQDTLKYAYLYAKSVTLVNTHWKETNAVMLKNRRMGISQTGIIEAMIRHGRRQLLEWCDNAYKYLRKLDEEYSNWLCIPKSIKITTVKPSGTVSLLPGVPPGIHYPHSEYYIRRIRISRNSDLIEPLRRAGYKIEQDKYSKNSLVVEFPINEEYFDRSKDDVSIWEQAENAAAYQKYWSDNQVSITITFTKREAHEIQHVLECFEDKLKSVSFLPITDHGYEQAPYEKISKEKYDKMLSNIKPINLDRTSDRAIGEKFCDSDRCEIRLE